MGVGPQTTEMDELVYVWGGKILPFWQVRRYISEMTQNMAHSDYGQLI